MVGIQIIGSGTRGTGTVSNVAGGLVIANNGTNIGTYTILNFSTSNALSYKYWKFNFTINSSQSNIGLSGIQFVNSSGTILNPLNGPFASTDYEFFSIPNAFDGNQSTFWASSGGSDPNPYIGWAFTAQTTITSIVLYPRNDGNANQGPLQVIVKGSNDYVNFTNLTTFTPATWVAGTSQTISGISGTYLVWRLYMNYNPSASGQNTALSEIQFFNGASQISTKQITYGPSASSDNYTANNGNFNITVPQAFQGFGGWWQSSTSDSSPYIQYCFITPTYVSSISLYSTNDSTYAIGPSQIIVQGSNDGITFTNVYTFTPAAWAQGVSQTISGFSGTYTFWRLACTLTGGQNRVGLGNIIFYNSGTAYSYPIYSSEINNTTNCQFNVFDGVYYNAWETSTSDSSPSITYVFSSSQTISSFIFLSPYYVSDAPSAIIIYGSNDNINYSKILITSNITFTTNTPINVAYRPTNVYNVYGGTLATQQIAHGATNLYPLNSATSAIDVINAQNGTYVGTVTSATSIVVGESASANFSAGAYLTLPFANLPQNSSTGAFSIELVFEIVGIGSNGPFLLYNAHADSDSDGFQISGGGNPTSYAITLNFPSGRILYMNCGTYQWNTPNLMTITYDGSTVTTYQNGSFVASQSASGTLNSAQFSNIIMANGTLVGGNLYQYGPFQNLAFYPLALTSQQILSHYFALTNPDTAVSGNNTEVSVVNSNIFDIDIYINGYPGTFQQILRYVFTRPSKITIGYISAMTASTYISNFIVEQNSSVIGTLTLSSGMTSASIPIIASFAAGDVLTIFSPPVPDPTLNNLSISITGTR
jgi:hypothetical protein